MSIQTTIAGSVTTLPPSLARVARLVGDDPSAVVESTINELAARCGTSVASVVRFCRAIGFDGYAALRRALASELGRESAFSAHAGFGSEIAVGDSLREATAKVAGLEALAIEETVSSLDYDVLEAVVDALDGAQRILLFGVGASRLVADDLGHKLLRVGRNAIVLSDAHEATASAVVRAAPTAAVGFSQSGSTIETVRFLEAARSAGAATIGVTGSSGSPLARVCDHTLFTHAREPQFRAGAMVSRIAQLALVDCIFLGVAQRRFDDTVDALRRTADAARSFRSV